MVQLGMNMRFDNFVENGMKCMKMGSYLVSMLTRKEDGESSGP